MTRLAGVLGIGVDELTGGTEPALLAAAGAQRLARLAAALADIDVEAHRRTLARLSPRERAEAVAYIGWRAEREQGAGAPPGREFSTARPDPEGVRVLGDPAPEPPAQRAAS